MQAHVHAPFMLPLQLYRRSWMDEGCKASDVFKILTSDPSTPLSTAVVPEVAQHPVVQHQRFAVSLRLSKTEHTAEQSPTLFSAFRP